MFNKIELTPLYDGLMNRELTTEGLVETRSSGRYLTEIGSVHKASSGKFEVYFETARLNPDGSVAHPMCKTTSGFQFDTHVEAIAAGERALHKLAVTGQYPDLSEKF